MVFIPFNAVTMARVEDKGGVTAKKRWRPEDGVVVPSGFVVLITPERGSDANGAAQ